MSLLSDSSTLGEARNFIEERLDEGLTCPACRQHAQRYRRKINAGMARALVLLYLEHRETGAYWVKLRDVLLREGWHTGDYCYLPHWGLIEAADERLEDGNSAGLWRITESGRAFVRGEIRLPKYAHLYIGSVQTFSGPQVSITECIGDRFNLQELLQRAA